MKILVYTNLESYDLNGILKVFNLSFENIRQFPVKGINYNSSCNKIENQDIASSFDILLAHCFSDVEDILPLLHIKYDWAIVLHFSNGLELRNLISNLFEISPNKVLYRYEYSESGPTIKFLNNLSKCRGSKEATKICILNYLDGFEKDSILDFKKDLVDSPTLLDVDDILEKSSNNQPIPFLWKTLFNRYPALGELAQKFVFGTNQAQKNSAYLQITQILK